MSSFQIDAICRGEWPAGTRVRCVDAYGRSKISVGSDFIVRTPKEDGCIQIQGDSSGWYDVSRFKPVVRVPMGRAYDLTDLLRRAVDAFDAMSPEQQKAHRVAQRRSWVIGETMLSHPEMSRADAEALVDRVLA